MMLFNYCPILGLQYFYIEKSGREYRRARRKQHKLNT